MADNSIQWCFKCYGIGHFQVDYHNQTFITLQEIEKFDTGLQEAMQQANHFKSEYEEEDEIVEQPNEGELLVIRRALHSTITPKADEQRENIFRAWCTINGKMCNLIIDGGSYTNIRQQL